MTEKMEGYFDGDGTPMNPDLAPKPSLCVMCRYEGDSKQEVLCNLTRLDQQGDDDFHCDSF